MFSVDLIFEAVLFGILLGCFYAAVSLGLSVAFGLLDVPYVAHPALLILGSYFTYALCQTGIDPIVCGLLLMPVFYLIGIAFYRFYYETFEKRSTDTGVRGLAFFFGMAFIIEVCLILVFGVDQRTVSASYIVPHACSLCDCAVTHIRDDHLFFQDLQRTRHQSSWAR